nr:hypothetical protein [uncultured archaeon]
MEEAQAVTMTEVKEKLCGEGLCSERTIERKVKKLVQDGEIRKRGRRDSKLIPTKTLLTTQPT